MHLHTTQCLRPRYWNSAHVDSGSVKKPFHQQCVCTCACTDLEYFHDSVPVLYIPIIVGGNVQILHNVHAIEMMHPWVNIIAIHSTIILVANLPLVNVGLFSSD